VTLQPSVKPARHAAWLVKAGKSVALLISWWLSSLLLCGQTSLSERGLTPERATTTSPLQTGSYYALIIGNNDYKYMHKLQTPANDAVEMAKLLGDRYGFQTQVLINADRNQILTALVNYRKTLHEDSNLLVYYAGHGHHDPDTNEAYWLPIDAQPDNPVNWISADDITSNIKAIQSDHVLIVSDSCYSGYLVASRAGNAGINPEEHQALLAKMLKSKSRNLMSSGGDEPVADDGAPGHSIFAAAILDSLRQMDENTFTAGDLFYKYIQPEVGGRSAQLPQYNWIFNSGHMYGDFVFSRPLTAKLTAPTAPTAALPAVTAMPPGATAPARTASRTGTAAAASRSSRPPGNVSAWAVAFHGTILHTHDGGATWERQNSGTSTDLSSISFVTPQSGWAVGDSGTVLHTDDGGVTWKQQNSGTTYILYSVAFATPKSGWAVGQNGTIIHTDDGGRTWNSQNSGTTANFGSITFVTPQLGWAVGTELGADTGLILHTDDGGRTWKRQSNAPDPILVTFADPQSGWVVGWRGKIVHTDDGGRTWRPQDSGTESVLISVAFPTLRSGWVVGQSGTILHTEEAGNRWISQNSGSSQHLRSVAFATPQSGWIVGEEGTILHTEDGGLTWKPQTSDTSENLQSIALAPAQ
jgi:photosystem II stability/assembly factor-like uncharacterized protein/uncharacterized caspase-like protein